MPSKNEILKNIPKVDEILSHREFSEIPYAIAHQSVVEILEVIRVRIATGGCDHVPETTDIIEWAFKIAKKKMRFNFCPVINGTGIILHTNLGRAPLSERAVNTALNTCTTYCDLEYNVSLGQRGHRCDHVKELITELTGAESAVVVNNNAAAVFLVLAALSNNKDTIIPHGELVEIGGSFRVPAIMESSGAILKAVGTTNKTYLSDYEEAINENTGLLMKVHTSNYKVVGFTKSVQLSQLVDLGSKHNIPVYHDLGSGCIYDLGKYGIKDEPLVPDSIKQGCDIVSFSGDKLFGGPQCGIIIGKKQYIDILNKHPLMRILRCDKMTLTLLEATLRSYIEEKAFEDIPILKMISTEVVKLKKRAESLVEMLDIPDVFSYTEENECLMGGGSAPDNRIPTWTVVIEIKGLSLEELSEKLRRKPVPIIGRISHDKYMLDMRTVSDEDLTIIRDEVSSVVRKRDEH